VQGWRLARRPARAAAEPRWTQAEGWSLPFDLQAAARRVGEQTAIDARLSRQGRVFAEIEGLTGADWAQDER